MIIAISHSKGGVGKSNTSYNLAIELSKLFNVELVDLDFQRTVTYLNEYRAEPLTIFQFDNESDLKDYIAQDNSQKVTIIDCGGFDSDLNRIAMITADLIITPVSDHSTELLGLIRFEKILKELSEALGETLTVRILLNDVNPQKKNLTELKNFIEENKHFFLLNSPTPTRADYEKALQVGKSIIEKFPNSKGADEMRELTKEITKIIKDKING